MKIKVKAKREKHVLVIWDHYKIEASFILLPYVLACDLKDMLGDAHASYITAKMTPTATSTLRTLLFGSDDWATKYGIPVDELMTKDYHIVRVCHTGQYGVML